MRNPNRPPLAYASLAGDDAALPRWLRVVVGCAAVAYGGGRAIGEVYFLALTRKWIPMAIDWGQFGIIQDVFEWAQAGSFAVVCAGGVVILRRPAPGIVVLRLGCVLALLTIFGAPAYETLRERAPFHYRALQAWSLLTHCTLEALLVGMTLGPLGRALRRG